MAMQLKCLFHPTLSLHSRLCEKNHNVKRTLLWISPVIVNVSVRLEPINKLYKVRTIQAP